MAEMHLWVQAWSDQGDRILVSVESVDKAARSTLAVDLHGSRLQNARNRSVPGLTEDDNKRTTEDGWVNNNQGQKGSEALAL